MKIEKHKNRKIYEEENIYCMNLDRNSDNKICKQIFNKI